MYNLKDCIKGEVTFLYYRSSELHYECENGFRFVVPIDDTGSAEFKAKDKAILFMRWIRQFLEIQKTISP